MTAVTSQSKPVTSKDSAVTPQKWRAYTFNIHKFILKLILDRGKLQFSGPINFQWSQQPLAVPSVFQWSHQPLVVPLIFWWLLYLLFTIFFIIFKKCQKKFFSKLLKRRTKMFRIACRYHIRFFQIFTAILSQPILKNGTPPKPIFNQTFRFLLAKPHLQCSGRDFGLSRGRRPPRSLRARLINKPERSPVLLGTCSNFFTYYGTSANISHIYDTCSLIAQCARYLS